MNAKQFAETVLSWYHRHGRHDLPWQKHVTVYRVWVSEIMLQQTQVTTVIPYFKRFMKRFPNVKILAKATIDEVLTYWSGLGYYARARHLHQTAQTVYELYKGRFPREFSQLSALPGIGRSTAGAILSLGMEVPATILDGNVKRVLTRYHGLQALDPRALLKRLWELAETYTPQEGNSHYNQAMMDLGALVCMRTKPHCSSCPLEKGCQTLAHNKPFKTPLLSKQNRRTECVSMLLIKNENSVILIKRPTKGTCGGR